MTNQCFAIDACALIDASKAYSLKKKSFSHVWEKFSELFEKGRLISNVEILDEIKDHDLKEWINRHKEAFKPLSEKIQKLTTEILSKYPELVRIRSKKTSSNGDPFLIATAIDNKCTVITNERSGDESTKDYRIPNICKKYNITCISLNEFIDEIFD
jgi:hypothetical protein